MAASKRTSEKREVQKIFFSSVVFPFQFNQGTAHQKCWKHLLLLTPASHRMKGQCFSAGWRQEMSLAYKLVPSESRLTNSSNSTHDLVSLWKQKLSPALWGKCLRVTLQNLLAAHTSPWFPSCKITEVMLSTVLVHHQHCLVLCSGLMLSLHL